MIRSQRNIHRWVWILIIVLIPFGIYFSIRDVAFNPSGPKGTVSTFSNTGTKVNEESGIAFKLVQKTDGALLQLIVGRPLKSASALIYVTNDKGEKGRLIGQVRGMGTYVFELNTKAEEIILYDAIKEIELKRFALTWD